MKVFIIAAVTLDGKIGYHSDHLADWTSPADKKSFVRLTKAAGAVVFGANTFATINRALPGRRTIVYTHHPEKITAEGVEPTAESPQALVTRLKQEGTVGLAVCGGTAIYDLFMQAGVVDELYLTFEPLVFGRGLPLFSTENMMKLQLLKSVNLDENTMRLHYAVDKTAPRR